jgi:hypothetical protein
MLQNIKFRRSVRAASSLPTLTLAAAMSLGPAAAQDAITSTENGRYTMTPSDGGFLRLDTRTGQVSHCSATREGAQCRSAPDERNALEQEIARLAKENAELKSKLAGGPAVRPSIPLPNKDDMDRALTFAEEFMRRMMRLMREEPAPDRT